MSHEEIKKYLTEEEFSSIKEQLASHFQKAAQLVPVLDKDNIVLTFKQYEELSSYVDCGDWGFPYNIALEEFRESIRLCVRNDMG